MTDMMISTPYLTDTVDCSCGEVGCCHTGALERPRYFPRQVVTAAELTLEHDYQRERSRRHNRMLHGWGVVCGAEVCLLAGKDGPVPWKVVIKPGFILGSCGDEIVIDCDREVDLRTNGLMCMSGVQPGEVSDPWCSDDRTERAGTVCIGIQYREFMSRPVRVHPVGCGCGGNECEYSRWRDGYEVGFLPDCSDTRRSAGYAKQLAERGTREIAETYDPIRELVPARRPASVRENFGDFECPPCPTDPWVVLACVEVDRKGTVSTIDNCGCRRLVVNGARFSWRCDEDLPGIPRQIGEGRAVETDVSPVIAADAAWAPALAPEPAEPAPEPVRAPERAEPTPTTKAKASAPAAPTAAESPPAAAKSPPAAAKSPVVRRAPTTRRRKNK
jgi:hypothetical protein